MTETIQSTNSPGRPTVLTPEIRLKIEEAAALDATIEEIALWAGVHRSTLYRWMQDDEGLRDRIEELRQKPILKARNTVVSALSDPNHAFRYLERKRSKEFMPTAKLEHAGQVAFVPGHVDPKTEQIKNEYEDKLRQALAEEQVNESEEEVRPVIQKQDAANMEAPVEDSSIAVNKLTETKS